MKTLEIGDVVLTNGAELVILGLTVKGEAVTFEAVSLAAAARMGITPDLPESA